MACKLLNLKIKEVCAMRLTTKLISVLILVLMVSYLSMVNGCGKAVSGRASGGCPDSTAPAGSSISAPTNLGTPHVAGGDCYPTLGFTVKDSTGAPMSGICVEIFTNGNIALHSGLPNCSTVAANPQTSVVTRTDYNGNVIVELLTSPTATGGTTFVEVASGALSAVATTPASIP
jgi:hypothetical protein